MTVSKNRGERRDLCLRLFSWLAVWEIKRKEKRASHLGVGKGREELRSLKRERAEVKRGLSEAAGFTFLFSFLDMLLNPHALLH